MEDVVWTIALIAVFAFVFSIGERWARKLAGPTQAANSTMTENSDLEKRLGDLERRHNKTRELLIGFLSIATALLVALFVRDYFKLEGATAAVLVVGGSYAITNLLVRWLLKD